MFLQLGRRKQEQTNAQIFHFVYFNIDKDKRYIPSLYAVCWF